jgi:hypothetical protein
VPEKDASTWSPGSWRVRKTVLQIASIRPCEEWTLSAVQDQPSLVGGDVRLADVDHELPAEECKH